MTTFELPIGEKALIELKFYAQEEGKTVTDMIMEGIRLLLEDFEDIRDYERGMAALANGEPTTSWEDVQRELGL